MMHYWLLSSYCLTGVVSILCKVVTYFWLRCVYESNYERHLTGPSLVQSALQSSADYSNSAFTELAIQGSNSPFLHRLALWHKLVMVKKIHLHDWASSPALWRFSSSPTYGLMLIILWVWRKNSVTFAHRHFLTWYTVKAGWNATQHLLERPPYGTHIRILFSMGVISFRSCILSKLSWYTSQYELNLVVFEEKKEKQ